MRNTVVAVLLIVIAIAGTGTGYLIGTNSRATQTTTSTTSTAVQPCGDRVGEPNRSPLPVLLMQPSTTAYICVTYQTGWKGDPNYNFSVYLSSPFVQYHFYPFDVSNEQCIESGSGTACSPDVSNAFRVTAFPTTVYLTALTDYVVVLYAITALANSTGYYSNGPSFACGFWFPLAVGHPASDVNSSDFGQSQVPPVQCPGFIGGPLLSPVSVSVSGMGVTYLKS